MKLWERCRICGEEWPAGSRPECTKYRDGDHRRLRTNQRGQDVETFSKPDTLIQSEPDPHFVTKASWGRTSEPDADVEPEQSQQTPDEDV